MPLTLRLSQQFYDRLGTEVVNELVDVLNSADAAYRSDLYQVNELNFVRFDARLEQRLAEFETRVERRISAFEAGIERRLAEFETKVERRLAQFEATIERRMSEFEAKVERRLEQRIADSEQKFEAKLADTNGKIDQLSERMTKQYGSTIRWMFTFWTGQFLALGGLMYLLLHAK